MHLVFFNFHNHIMHIKIVPKRLYLFTYGIYFPTTLGTKGLFSVSSFTTKVFAEGRFFKKSLPKKPETVHYESLAPRVVTEGCPFSLADAQGWQGFLKVTISNKFFLQFSLSYRVLCFFPWAFLEFMKIFNHSFLLRPLYLCDSSQYNVNHVNNLHMLIIGK